ncbi:unnamed protein product [Closterium sp. NIES-65]|nr:unnamed protein product [Closterium sp. NIES-65]
MALSERSSSTHPIVAIADSKHTALPIVTRAPLITLVDPHRLDALTSLSHPHSLSSLALPLITLADPHRPHPSSSLARPVVALASQSLPLPLVAFPSALPLSPSHHPKRGRNRWGGTEVVASTTPIDKCFEPLSAPHHPPPSSLPRICPRSPHPLPCFPVSPALLPPIPPLLPPIPTPSPSLLQPTPSLASTHPLPCLPPSPSMSPLLPPYRLPTLPPAHLTTSNPSLLIRAQVWRKVHVVRSILALGYDVVLTDRAVLWGVNSRAVVANADLFTVRSNTHTHAQVL